MHQYYNRTCLYRQLDDNECIVVAMVEERWRRKNCRTGLRGRGRCHPRRHATPAVPHSRWDADVARDRPQDLVATTFGGAQATIVIDETGFLKKGTHSVGAQRQYTGTAGKVENAQVGVFLEIGRAHV